MSKRKVLISPSLLSSNFSRLADEVKALEEAGADWIHFDVMDGHFVPNLTFGAKMLESIRPLTTLPLDVHLMIENPERYVESFISAGADYITIHVETLKENGQKIFEKIREKGSKPGITLRPRTSAEEVLPFFSLVDLVLVMTVEPGFGSQVFMKDQVEKIDFFYSYREKLGLSALIEVDGGINAETAKLCKKADVLVSGHYIFKSFYEEVQSSSLSKFNKADESEVELYHLNVKAYAKAIQRLRE